MARSSLLRQKFRPRARRHASPGSIHFAASLALVEPANAVAISAREKFLASVTPSQQNAVLSIAGIERFSSYLTLAAPANLAAIYAYEIADDYPGHAVIGDAAQGGFLTLADQTAYGLTPSDVALFDVQIMESI